jgi:hypothetical protein
LTKLVSSKLQRGVPVPPQQGLGLAVRLAQQRLIIPGRIADELLQALIAALRQFRLCQS